MRRVLLASLMGIGLLFGTTTVPAPVARATAPNKSEVVKTIVNADSPFNVPTTEIVVPEKPVRRGHQVIFGVAPITNAPKELLHYTHVWVITPDPGDIFTLPDGSKGSFGTGDEFDPNKYTLTVVTSYLFVDASNAASLVSTKTTKEVSVIDRDRPKPPPDPPPNPGPDPIKPVPDPIKPVPDPIKPGIPDGKYKLGQFVFDLVKSLPKSECETLAKELKGLAGEIAAGAATPNSGIRTKAELVRRSAQAFTTALGSNLKAWQPALDALAVKMDSLNIVALPDCQQAYMEVATGLEAR